MMKKLILAGVFAAFSGAAVAADWTEARTVDSIQVNKGGTYYFKSEQGWGAAGCPNAPFLYIPGNRPAAEAFLKLAIAAKTEAGLKLKAQGACSDDAHILIDYLIVTN